MREAVVVSILLFASLAGCTSPPVANHPTEDTTASYSCGHSATFHMMGLYDALANVTSGNFTHEQWAPTLPYENATLRERWRDYSLVAITRTFGHVADVPTTITIRPRGTAFEIVGSAEANLSVHEVEAYFVTFAKDTLEANESELSQWESEFVRSKGPSAYREGVPGNATPDGAGPFREYEQGPVYAYTYAITSNATSRIQQLVDALPSFDGWMPLDAETGRMLYSHEGPANWTVWFEQPRNNFQINDVRITSLPTGESSAFISTSHQNQAGALESLRNAFKQADLTQPLLAPTGMAPVPCGD